MGYACNFKCAHCSLTEDHRLKLTSKEVDLLSGVIRRYKPPSVLFVGGEPTFYTDIANAILRKSGDLAKISFRITTNGYFASTKSDAVKSLSAFSKLDMVQLSYDKFHAKFLPFKNIRNLFLACRELGKSFNVTCAVESPMDVLLAEKIKNAGRFNIAIQRVLPIGSAKKNNIKYPYPSLDEEVLSKSCPNKGKIMYFCGRGFSACCSNLVFNSRDKFMIHKTIGAHVKSRFYQKVIHSNFGQFAGELGLTAKDLRPEHSIQCNLCEHLFGLQADRGLARHL